MRIITAVTIAALLVLTACNSPAIPPGNYGTVTGTITSTSGQPVAGVSVQADYGPSAVTGADGKYTIPTVPTSSANSPAHIQVTNVPSGYSLPAPRDDVQVVAGQTTASGNFVLSPI